jgi:hypothetical protein
MTRLSTTSRATLINQTHVKGTIYMTKSVGRNNKSIVSGAREDKSLLTTASGRTEAVYNPNYEFGMVRLNRGHLPLDRSLSREKLPTGKPCFGPNLVGIKHDTGSCVDPDKVLKGYDSLGHLSQKVVAPNFSLTKARDLGYYM